ncbi:MAG: hypothetical protein KDA60_12710 [Planctomycetales bacterium]|nr:hypothetical protein [Planctomycetales bacterium]
MRRRRSHFTRSTSLAIERFEPRWAFSGVTVITHGFQLTGDFPDWTISMGQAILDRADGDRTDRTTGSLFKHQPNSGNWVALDNAVWNNSNSTSDHIVLLFDWASESNNFSDGWLEAAADSLYTSLLGPNTNLSGELNGHSFAELALEGGLARSLRTGSPPGFDLHFIGHSRGAVLNSLVTERFAANFPALAVDHVTSLDPHPASPMNDPGYVADNPNANSQLFTYANVTFADNYYRQDGTYETDLDFNGIFAAGAFNLQLPESILVGAGSTTEHSDVHTWYYGTITDALPTDYTGFSGAGRNHDGDNAFPESWYNRQQLPDGEDVPPRGVVGFHFSQIGEGDRSVVPKAGAPRNPSLPALLFNGDFSVGQNNQLTADGLPGWEYHGGSHDADLTSDGRLHLGESGLSNFDRATHNPFYVPAYATRIEFELQVTDASEDDELLIVVGGSPHRFGLNNVGTFNEHISVDLFRRDVITFQAILDAGSLIGSDLFVDNILLIGETPQPADFNRDGLIDANDIDLLFAAIGSSSTNMTFDLDGTGAVDFADADRLIEQILATHYGDANLDRQVDGVDFQIWQEHRFTDCVHWACGNFNGDRVTDGSDFNLWLSHRFLSGDLLGSGDFVPRQAATASQTKAFHWHASTPHAKGPARPQTDLLQGRRTSQVIFRLAARFPISRTNEYRREPLLPDSEMPDSPILAGSAVRRRHSN